MTQNLFSPKTTTARFPGLCWTCRQRIEKGDQIEYLPGAWTDPSTGKTRAVVWHADRCLAPTPQQRRTPPSKHESDEQDATQQSDPRDNHDTSAEHEAPEIDDDGADQDESDEHDEHEHANGSSIDDDARAAIEALRRLTRRTSAPLDARKVREIADLAADEIRADVATLANRLDSIEAQKPEAPEIDLSQVTKAADAAAYAGTRRAIEEAQDKGQDTSTLTVPPPVPTLDTLYQDDNKTSAAIRFCLATDRHALVSGPSGSGKTYPVRMECAKAGRPVVELSAGDGIGYSHLVGSVTLERDKQGGIVTGWRDGAVLRAMRHGAVLLLDELDQLPRPLLALLYGILEPGRTAELYVPEIGASVRAKQGFQVIGTGNTIRDTSGQYSGERPSAALLNRLAQIPADYLSAAQEQKILERVGLRANEAKALAAVLTALRLQYNNQALTVAPSTRTGVQVALALLGKKPDGTNGQPRVTWSAALTLYVTGALPDDQANAARLAATGALASHKIANPDECVPQ